MSELCISLLTYVRRKEAVCDVFGNNANFVGHN